ncbi:MAG: hypothetical protein WCC58_09555 [Burkholderiales bacterium]
MEESDYVLISRSENAVSSLELASVFLTLTKSDYRYWKWYVIALHSGLQGLFSLALHNGNTHLVQKPNVMQQMISAEQLGSPYPLPRMDNFLKLYKKLQIKNNLRHEHSMPFDSNDIFDKAIEWVDSCRDDFLHFNVGSWQIEVKSIIENSILCCEIADFIVSKSHSIIWQEEDYEQRAKSSLLALQKALLFAER